MAMYLGLGCGYTPGWLGVGGLYNTDAWVPTQDYSDLIDLSWGLPWWLRW